MDLNVHFPEGAIKKDGPSAGTATVTAITSALTGNPVRSDVAMTGEITLRGDVLPIGGLKEKLLAALRGGVKTVCIPQENEKDLWDIPKKVTKNLNIVPVKTIDEVLDIALEFKPKEFMPTTMEEWTLSGYEKREKQRKLRMEAEEHKNYMEIRDSSDSSVNTLNNDDAEGDERPQPDKKRKGPNSRKPKGDAARDDAQGDASEDGVVSDGARDDEAPAAPDATPSVRPGLNHVTD